MTRNFRVWMFLTILSAFFLILGQLIGGRQGLLVGFIFAMSLNFYLYFSGDSRILRFFRAEHLKGQDPWGVIDATLVLAERIRIPIPEIYLMSIDTPTAFSIGRMWGASKIVCSEGLLKRLTPDELKSVLALQMIHIQRLHDMTSGIGGQLAELLYLAAEGLDALIDLANFIRKDKNHCHFFQRLVMPVANLLIRWSVGHKSFLETDQAAAQIIGSKEKMAQVLWKLHSFAATRPITAPPSAGALFIVNPLTDKHPFRYFEPHPAIETRIEKLIGSYPL